MNYRIITYTLGLVLNIEAISLVLPLVCALIYGDKTVPAFLISIVICLFVGVLLSFTKPKDKTMYAKEGFLTVALSWMVISIFGALPFYISGEIPLYIDALFETASGFSTTGATILTDIEVMSKSLLFWRSFTHWIGGMGVLVFLVALFPVSGGGNMHMIRAESPGPSVNKLVPKVKSTAKTLYGIYLVLTVILFVFLLLGEMGVFEAITTSFGTAGTGGFGVKNTSIAGYSPYIQIVITVFMLIFGVDFSVYYLILAKKSLSGFKSEEVRAFFSIVVAAIALITLNLYLQPTPEGTFATFGEMVRHSAFQVASIITTSGFSTVNFDLWPEFSKIILVGLIFIGACAGSTGGGIKVSRIITLIKSIGKEIRISIHPRSMVKINMNGREIRHETIRSINVYIMAYIFIFALSLLVISIDGFDFTTNFTAVATTINNVGPGLSVVGPSGNFSSFSALSKLVFVFDMIAGRLEILPMIVLLSPHIWKK